MMTDVVAAPKPVYARTIITTKRKAEPAAPFELKFTDADVKSLSAVCKDPTWLARRRRAAWKLYHSIPMPTLNDEAWRRTDLRPFKWHEAELSALNASGKRRPVPTAFLRPLVGKEQGGQLAINGGKVESRHFDAALRRKGVVFTDFATAAVKHEALVKKFMGRAVKANEGKFAAMAESLMDSGIFLYVPKNVEVALPLHSVLWASAHSQFTRVLVVLEEGASVTYVHELASPEGATAPTLHAGIVELVVGKNASLKFVELQSLGLNVWNVTHERAIAGADAKLDWVFSAIGSHVTKNFSEIDLNGDGGWGRMSGFYFAEGDQHLDHDTQQNHNAPHTTSDLLFKGALRDQSRSVWQGMIYVAPGAQKADGYQANRNLVLSKSARADSIPGLEILADDVRCTHGATVGQLEEEHIFYLMSRGVPRPEAQKVLVDGFFDPIMQRVAFDGVIARLKKSIETKMARSGSGE